MTVVGAYVFAGSAIRLTLNKAKQSKANPLALLWAVLVAGKDRVAGKGLETVKRLVTG